MEYKVKIQKVKRLTNKSFYVNLPVGLAEAIDIKKSEEFEWFIDDRNTLVLKRLKDEETLIKS